jgi:hypothetical protein
MEPARSRDSKADLAAELLALLPAKPEFSVGVPWPGLNGLVEGVGRDVLGIKEEDGMGNKPPGAAEGEKREGKVPARARLVDVCAACVDSGIA